jgi:hypothetical protein
MFAYASNCPIGYVDPDGARPVSNTSPDGNVNDSNYSDKPVNTTAPKSVPAVGGEGYPGGVVGNPVYPPGKPPCLETLCACHGAEGPKGNPSKSAGAQMARETHCYVVACDGFYDSPTGTYRVFPLPFMKKTKCHIFDPNGVPVKDGNGNPISFNTPMTPEDWAHAQSIAGVQAQ